MKFSEDMDFSIWDCPYSQDESYNLANCWPYDLYFNPQLDVIEEDALNEKSCIQVLKILIAKADTEILEIEEEILMLRSELALVDEKWHAMCFTTLSQSINCLDRLIQDLKNANVNDELHLGIQQVHPEPAERIHEVLRALLQDYFLQSDKQNKASLAAHSSRSSNARIVASTQHKEKILNSSTSSIDSGISTPAKKTLNSLSSGPVTTADEGVKEKVANAVTKDSAAEPLRDEACSNQTKKRIRMGSEDFCEDEVGELSYTEESIVLSTTEEPNGVNFSKTAKATGGIVGPRGVSIKQEAEDSSMKQKYKEVVMTQIIKKEATSQLLETKMASIESPCRVKGQGALLIETDHGVGESLLVLFNQKDKDERITQIKVELEENNVPKTHVAALAESNSSFCMKLRSEEMMEKEWPLYAKMVREPCLAEELGLKSPPRKLKKQCKSRSADKTANSDLRNKNSDETQLALVVAKNVDSTPRKKRKIRLDLPVMKENENLREFQMRLAKSCGTFKGVEATGCLPSDISCLHGGKLAAAIDPSGCIADLKYMTKTQLSALAKQHKLK